MTILRVYILSLNPVGFCFDKQERNYMKMDKVASSGNDEFYTPLYAIQPILKYLRPLVSFRHARKFVR